MGEWGAGAVCPKAWTWNQCGSGENAGRCLTSTSKEGTEQEMLRLERGPGVKFLQDRKPRESPQGQWDTLGFKQGQPEGN